MPPTGPEVSDLRQIARRRLHAMRLAGEGWADAAAVVTGLLGVQAENAPQAAWAVACRTVDPQPDDLRRRLDDGTVLRTHVLRHTWHFVTRGDIRWLLDLTAPRLRPQVDAHRELHGMTRAELDAGVALLERELAGGTHRTRASLGERLGDAGLPSAGQPLGVLLMHAELEAVICSGRPEDGGTHTYALLAERAPGARRFDRDAALAEIALRYFTGHGPATEHDLAYWATLTLTDVRAGIAAVNDRLGRFVHDGRTYWYGAEPPVDDMVVPRAHLLQILDEYHNGYQDSRYALDAAGIVPRGRAARVGMTLVDGQMVGDLHRTVRAADVRFVVGCFRDLADDERSAVEEAAGRYGRFLGRDASVRFVPPGS